MRQAHAINPPDNTPSCPYCGAADVGGYAGCQAVMHRWTADAFGDRVLFAVFRAALDCYCMQHPEIYGVSAKSYAAHLAGLCCEVEYAGSRKIHAAIQRWLNGSADLSKPEPLRHRGEITVLCLRDTDESDGYRRVVSGWAGSVWRAYADQQELARDYVRIALAAARQG